MTSTKKVKKAKKVRKVRKVRKTKNKKGLGSRLFYLVLLTGLVLFSLAAAFFVIFLQPGTLSDIPPAKVASVHKRPPQIMYEEPTLPVTRLPVLAPALYKLRYEKKKDGRVAIIIDDIGYKKSIAEQLLDLDMNITFSFLPFGPHTAVLQQKVGERGCDILLHLPMEPKNLKYDPGPGALYLKMSKSQIGDTFKKDLASVPIAIGLNNHMGSRFSEDRKAMGYLMELIKERDLFFVDSLTSAGSVGYELAGKTGIKAGKRAVFLDNEQDKKKIKKQFDVLIRLARKNGSAIGIGHPYPATVAALSEYRDTLRENVTLVPVHSLVH